MRTFCEMGARRERPRDGRLVRFDFLGQQPFVVEVLPTLTSAPTDGNASISFGYQSPAVALFEGVEGTIEGTTFTVRRASRAGATRRSARVLIDSGQSHWYWEKRGIVERVGTAHALYRADETMLARTAGLRILQLANEATRFEAMIVALSFASSASEHAANPGLSSCLWF